MIWNFSNECFEAESVLLIPIVAQSSDGTRVRLAVVHGVLVV